MFVVFVYIYQSMCKFMYVSCCVIPATVLNADDIQPRHCVVFCTDEMVELIRENGYCCVNSQVVTDKKQLFHGK